MPELNLLLVIVIVINQFALIMVMTNVSKRLQNIRDLVDWYRFRRF